jgi:hypothetical protein
MRRERAPGVGRTVGREILIGSWPSGVIDVPFLAAGRSTSLERLSIWNIDLQTADKMPVFPRRSLCGRALWFTFL